MKHKGKIKLISLLLALCLLSGTCALSAAADTADDTLNYLALGDSISAGYGLDNPLEDGFTALFADLLTSTYDTQVTLTNNAVSGLTAATLLTMLQTGMYDDTIACADVITLTIGGNDFMASFYEYLTQAYNAANGTDFTAAYIQQVIANPSGSNALIALALLNLATADGFADGLLSSDLFTDALSDFAKNLTAIGSYLRVANADAVIIIATQYNPYIWLGDSDMCVSIRSAFEMGTYALNSVIREVAPNFNIAVAETAEAFANSEENLCNAYVQGYSYDLDFHPNTAGHAVIAESMLAAYESAVDTSDTSDTPDTDTDDTTDTDINTDTDTDTSDIPDTDTDTDNTDTDTDTDTDSDSTTITIIIGDVDGNGTVNSVDALYILRISAGVSAADTRSAYTGDVNKDSTISTSDVLEVLRYVNGLSASQYIGTAETFTF